MIDRANRAAAVPLPCLARNRATVPTVPSVRRTGTVGGTDPGTVHGGASGVRHGAEPGTVPTPAEELGYTLFGEPLPMPRPRVGRWGVKPPSDAILELKARHAEAATLALPSGWDLEGPMAVYVVCHRKTARACDVDNLAKLPLDALTGVLWADDSQVVKLLVEKRRDELDPRTEIRVVRL